MNMKRLSRWKGLAACAALSGCAVGPNYEAPVVATPSAFVAESEAGRVHAGDVDIRDWWRSLRDPELNSLVDRALRSNLDLEVALNRVEEARARLYGAGAGEFPSVALAAGGGGGTGSDNTNGRVPASFRAAENAKGLAVTSDAGGLTANWDLDLFGKVKREVEAETADAEALEHAREWVYVTVASDVARDYLDMRARERKLAVLGQNIEAARATVTLAQSRLDRGLTDQLDVELARRQLATLEADRGPLSARIATSRNAIAVLLGQFPEELSKELSRAGAFPNLPTRIPLGLPADLLRRRPDIAKIERELAAANARIGSAIAALVPSVSITGAYGRQQGPLATPTSNPASIIWSLGPSVSMPFLDFGALDAQIEAADLKTKGVLASYRAAILNAVTTYEAQRRALADLDRALTAAREATRIATERYDRGVTDFLNVLDAQRQQFELEERQIAARQVEGEALVALFEALGGGWPEHLSVPSPRRPDPAALAAVKYVANPSRNPGSK